MKRNALKIIALLLILSVVSATLVFCTQGGIGPNANAGINGTDIVSIKKTATSGLVDTYTITFGDGETTTFTVTNGADGEQGIQGIQGVKGEDGHTPVITIQNGYWYIDGVNTNQSAVGISGATGNGISNIAKTSTEGLVDTYTITYTNGTTTTFTVTNGAAGAQGQQGIQGIQGEKGKDGHTPVITIQNGKWYIDGVDSGKSAESVKGDTGNGISSITKTSTVGLVDTYTITFTNGDTTTFTVTNGAAGAQGQQGIQGIQGEKGKDGHTPIITIQNGKWYIDGVDSGKSAEGVKGDTGNGISSIAKTSTVGLVDTYTITFTNGNTTTFTVTNGADGAQGIQGIQGVKGEDGHTPVITIQNGYWYIDGVNTQQPATGLPNNFQNKELNSEELWENGGITISGSEYKGSNTLRTKDFIPDDVSLVYVEEDYTFTAHIYDESGNCLGTWDGKEISNVSTKKLYYLNTNGLQGYKIRLMLYRFDATVVSLEECENIHFLNAEKAKAFYPTPTLTFIDDDGSLDALMNWESICDEIGIKITAALVTGVMGEGDKNPQKASWEDVMRLQNKGFEFVSHTHHHINLTKSSQELIIKEFEDSIKALREHGCESRYLVYPYNAINTDLMPLVRKYFSAGIGLGMESDNVLPIYTYHIRRYSINDTSISVEKEYNGETVSVHSFKSLETLKGYIDDAIANGGWVIIMTHLRNDGIFYFDEETRENIIELCKYATEKGVQIQTFGEAFEEYKNIMEEGTVYTTEHYIVDCNGVVHFRNQKEE